MQQTTLTKIPRIEVVDALRGFAVLAIILVHNLEHFIFPVYPDPANQPEWLNIRNGLISSTKVYSVLLSLSLQGKLMQSFRSYSVSHFTFNIPIN